MLENFRREDARCRLHSLPYYTCFKSKGGIESCNRLDECENPEVGMYAEKSQEITAYVTAKLLSPI